MNLRKLDLNLLVLFEAVYSSGNITLASQKLNLSQPTVSNGLARLRHQLDDPLFVRDKRGVKPTKRAQELIKTVREALNLLDSSLQSEEKFDPYTAKRVFRIMDSIESLPIPELIHEFQHYKNIHLEILPYFGFDFQKEFRLGNLDIACHISSPSDEDDLLHKLLYQADCVAITRKGHPMTRNGLDLNTYANMGHLGLITQLRVQSHVDENAKASDVHRRIVCSVTEFRRMPAMIAQSDLVAVIPVNIVARALDHYEIDIHPVPFELPVRNIFMIWQKGKEDDLGLNWLRDRLIDHVKREQSESLKLKCVK